MAEQIVVPNQSIDSEVFVAVTENNSIYTTSLDIAEKFQKQHKNILKTIKGLITQLEALNRAAKFIFIETTYSNRGKDYPMYYITRDGFVLLVMGFTGQDVLEWQLKYVAAFNRLEQFIRTELVQLKNQSKNMPMRGTKEFLALALLDAQQVIEEHEKALAAKETIIADKDKEIANAQPAIAFHNAVAIAENTILVRDLAKLITVTLLKNGISKVKIGEKKLFDWMKNNGYIIKQNSVSKNTPTQKSIDLGVLTIKESLHQGSSGIYTDRVARVTGKGQEYFINKILKIYQDGGQI